MIKVSIIIPIYKVEPYVERCINSVLRQTYRNLEVILVDDCTPDRSMEIAKSLINDYEYQNESPNDFGFVFLTHEHNRGLSAARNTGTAAATGEYVYYLDSDDEIIPKCIEKMVEAVIKYPDVEMVQGFRQIIPHRDNSDYTILKDVEYVDDNNWIREHFYCCGERLPVTAWNKLIRRSFLITNSLSFREGILHEDELWMFYVVKKLRKLYVIKENTYIHYIVSDSIMQKMTQNMSAHNWGMILDEIADNFDEPYCDRQVAVNITNLINHLDCVKDEKRVYRKLAKKFGKLLHETNHLFLSISLIIYVYTLPINRYRKGKFRLLNVFHSICR